MSLLNRLARVSFIIVFPAGLFSQTPKIPNDSSSFYTFKLQELRRQQDSVVYYGDRLFAFAKANQNKKAEFVAQRALGSAYSITQQFQKSNNHIHAALILADVLKDPELKFTVYGPLAHNYRRTQYQDSARFYYKKLEKWHALNGRPQMAVRQINSQGSTYFDQADYEKALPLFVEAYDKAQELNDSALIIETQRHLAETYLQKGMPNASIDQANAALNLAQETGLLRYRAAFYSIIARAYVDLGNVELATEYKSKANEAQTSIPKDAIVERPLNKDYVRSQSQLSENVIKGLEDKSRSKERWIYLTLGLLVLSILIAVYFIRKHHLAIEEVALLQGLVDSQAKVASERVVLKNGNVLESSEILYLKSDSHYLEYHTVMDKKITERNTFAEALENLPSHFIRTHRSFAVNSQHISYVNTSQLQLTNGDWIQISRTYKQGLQGHLEEVQGQF